MLIRTQKIRDEVLANVSRVVAETKQVAGQTAASTTSQRVSRADTDKEASLPTDELKRWLVLIEGQNKRGLEILEELKEDLKEEHETQLKDMVEGVANSTMDLDSVQDVSQETAGLDGLRSHLEHATGPLDRGATLLEALIKRVEGQTEVSSG